jgi:uncharacterized protein Usg
MNPPDHPTPPESVDPLIAAPNLSGHKGGLEGGLGQIIHRETRIFLIPQMRLTTAEILYRLPDFPQLLQSYIWQELDRVPDFPGLKKFLGFWERNLEGPLHSVTVSHSERRLGSFVFAEGELCLQ